MPSKKLKTSFAGGVGIFGAMALFISIALEILVLTGNATLAWWQVLMPIFIYLGLVVSGIVIVAVAMFVGLVMIARRR